MTRTQALAQALDGTVVEDSGYRGIIYVPSEGHHLRYHSSQGVHVVTRVGRRWNATRAVMSPADVDGFLGDAGVAAENTTSLDPLEKFTILFNGSVVHRFQSGGGVVNVKGHYLRISPISGLSFVTKVFTKWRATTNVWTRDELYDVLLTHQQVNFIEGKPLEETLRTLKEGIYHERTV